MFKDEAKKRLEELKTGLPEKEAEVITMKKEIKGLEAYLNSVDGHGAETKRGRKPKSEATAPAAKDEAKKPVETTKAQK